MVKFIRLFGALSLVLALLMLAGCQDDSAWEKEQAEKIKSELDSFSSIKEYAEVIVKKKDSSLTIKGLKGEYSYTDLDTSKISIDFVMAADELTVLGYDFESKNAEAYILPSILLRGVDYQYEITDLNTNKKMLVSKNKAEEYFLKDLYLTKALAGALKDLCQEKSKKIESMELSDYLPIVELFESGDFKLGAYSYKNMASESSDYISGYGSGSSLMKMEIAEASGKDLTALSYGAFVGKSMKFSIDGTGIFSVGEISADGAYVKGLSGFLKDYAAGKKPVSFPLEKLSLSDLKFKNITINAGDLADSEINIKEIVLGFDFGNDSFMFKTRFDGVGLPSDAVSMMSKKLLFGVDLSTFYDKPISFGLDVDLLGSYIQNKVSLAVNKLEFREDALGSFSASMSAFAHANKLDKNFGKALMLTGSLEKASAKFEDKGIINLGMQAFAASQGMSGEDLAKAGESFRQLAYLNALEQCRALKGSANKVCMDIASVVSKEGSVELEAKPENPIGIDSLLQGGQNIEDNIDAMGVQSSFTERK